MDHARREAIELAARIATRQTFGPFYDEPDSPFYEAEGLSPEETWERLAEKLALVTAHAILQGLENQTLHRGLLRLGMPQIFGEHFPESAGRIRAGREQGQFSVMLGTRESPVPQTYASIQAEICPRASAESAPLSRRSRARTRSRARARRHGPA